MPQYTVTSKENTVRLGMGADEIDRKLWGALGELRDIVTAFQAEHPPVGTVIKHKEHHLTTAITIETTPELATELATKSGIGDVVEIKREQVTCQR